MKARAQAVPPVDEVLFEFTPIGQVVRVAAFDPETLIEVVISGPASAGRTTLENVARAKLERARRRASEVRDPRP